MVIYYNSIHTLYNLPFVYVYCDLLSNDSSNYLVMLYILLKRYLLSCCAVFLIYNHCNNLIVTIIVIVNGNNDCYMNDYCDIVRVKTLYTELTLCYKYP